MVDSAILEISNRFAEALRQKYASASLYIFGSHALGYSKPESDIDLAIVLENYPDRLETQVELMKMGQKIDSRIEPHPFRKAEFNLSSPLAAEVLRYGVLVG